MFEMNFCKGLVKISLIFIARKVSAVTCAKFKKVMELINFSGNTNDEHQNYSYA